MEIVFKTFVLVLFVAILLFQSYYGGREALFTERVETLKARQKRRLLKQGKN